MHMSDWEDVLEQLSRDKKDSLPDIMLWGGEPLVYPELEKIVKLIRSYGFRLGMVTNGVLLDKYSELVKKEFSHIYVSLDGIESVHDGIRGKGVFQKVKNNLAALGTERPRVTLMCVISNGNIEGLRATATELLSLNCDNLIFQDMIALSESEAVEYKHEMAKLGIKAEYIDSWVMENAPRCSPAEAEQICENFSGRVSHLPHGIGRPCRSPLSHIHIAWNGNLLFCTDFYDFSAGNVKEESIASILKGERAAAFRKLINDGKCPTCHHCSWRHTEKFGI